MKLPIGIFNLILLSVCILSVHTYAQNHVLSPDAVSIEGTLLMLDNTTPHTAVLVQVVLPSHLTPRPPSRSGKGERGRG